MKLRKDLIALDSILFYMKILKCHQQCADLQQVLLFASLM